MSIPQSKKSIFERAQQFVVANSRSILIGIVLIVFIVFIYYFTRTDGWSSPDYKLLNKSHIGQTSRSDSGVDGWSKRDMIDSVSRFNRAAAE